MPSLPVHNVVENTIRALNEKIHALRTQRPTEHPLTEDEAKDLSNDIRHVVKVCIEEAFETVSSTDIRHLRQKLSLACHPDKLQSSQPELYANLATIKAGDVSYDLMNCPQQEINEINSNNPFSRLLNPFDSKDNNPNFKKDTSARHHSSKNAYDQNNPLDDIFQWIEGLGYFLSKNNRYPEPWSDIVKSIHALIDCILTLSVNIILIYLLNAEPILIILIVSLILAAGMELSLLHLFVNATEIQEIIDDETFFDTKSARLICGVIYAFVMNLFSDDVINLPLSSIFLRLLQLIMVPILLIIMVYVEVVRHIIGATLFLIASPAIAIKIASVLILNLPLYLFDGYEYIQKTSKAWFSPSSQENESPSDTAEDNNEQNVSPDSLTCHDLVSSPSEDTQQNTLDAKPVSVVAESLEASSPLSRCSVFASTISTRQEAHTDLNQGLKSAGI